MNPNKAGTSGVDRDHINRVIYEASKGSPYFENEIKKDQTISAKVAVMVKKAEVFSSISLVKETSLVSARISQLERDRDLTQTIVHVDMDAFYAAVEELERPDLKGKPMAVGGNDMLCTANYFARKFG